ncbi:MAG: periplasmic binding protein/LacI transcriptional regulator [Solirubrobacterales bacterium]|nr:periplasmic binding protein/LacI transcriptional regulator [Solirubrobacterales bacterium]
MLRFSAVAATLLAATVLAACGSDNKSSSSSTSSGSAGTTSGAAKTSDPQKVAYSNPVGAQPGQQDIVFGFDNAAKSLGWTAASIDANLSADKQVADIATMITQGQTGIASWTLDPGAAAGAYGQAKSAGIPVIGVNSEGTGIDATVWWELNTCNGKDSPIDRTAAYIAKAKPNAKVIVIGGPPVPSIQAYVKCFKAAAKTAGLNIVAEADNTKDTSAAAQPIVADLLTKHPDVDAVWNYNDNSALGGSAAITAAGKKVYTGSGDGIIEIGQNGDPDAIAAVKDGRLTGTWDPDTAATGWAMIKALSGFIGADKVADPPKKLVVKSEFWTKDNVASYKAPRDRNYTLANIPLVGGAAG